MFKIGIWFRYHFDIKKGHSTHISDSNDLQMQRSASKCAHILLQSDCVHFLYVSFIIIFAKNSPLQRQNRSKHSTKCDDTNGSKCDDTNQVNGTERNKTKERKKSNQFRDLWPWIQTMFRIQTESALFEAFECELCLLFARTLYMYLANTSYNLETNVHCAVYSPIIPITVAFFSDINCKCMNHTLRLLHIIRI